MSRGWGVCTRRGARAGTVGAVTGRLLLVALIGAACSSNASSPEATVPVTGPAAELAPSQMAAATVPPPTAPPPCVVSEVTAVLVEPRIDEAVVGGPDLIIELGNAGNVECDVDISASEGVAPDMEPSVRLAPGEVGHVWLEISAECAQSVASQPPGLVLDVNGEDLVVDLGRAVPCGAELVAFFTP